MNCVLFWKMLPPMPNQSNTQLESNSIDYWVFDLDNTLYPASKSLFPQIDVRMKSFIAKAMDLSIEDAHALQKRYYREYGTTLRGLMSVNHIDPKAFLDYVHDIDHSVLMRNPDLALALAGLPGRKFVFTNGSRPHAEKVLAALGVADHFDAIFDIVDADYIPKPDLRPYEQLTKRYDIKPRQTVMIEDLARNLEPAAAMGMTTVLLHQADHPDLPHNAAAYPDAPKDMPHVHHVITDLEDWLTGLTRAP